MNENEIVPEPPVSRPAGWYSDEAKPGIQRWWSGESWSDYTRPTPQAAPPGYEPDVATAVATDGPTSSNELPAQRNRRSIPIIGPVMTWWLARRRTTQIVSAVSAVAVLVLVFAVLLPTLLQPKHHFQAVISLSGNVDSMLSGSPDVEGSWDSCKGTGGYSDVVAGASATIRDGEGNIVGQLTVRNFTTSTLDAMLTADQEYGFAGWGDDAEEAKSLIESTAQLGLSCLLYVEGDVKDSDFYSFTFARRGELSYSREQLAEDDWWVGLSLGG